MTDPVATLTGEPVTIQYVADPRAGHGQFVLANPGSTPISAEVDALWFQAGEGRRPLPVASIFAPEDNRSLDPHTLRVEPGATLRFWVGFPAIAYEPPFGEAAAVGLRLRLGDTVLEARSPLQFLRRWPRGAV